jgi:hypothetical protein
MIQTLVDLALKTLEIIIFFSSPVAYLFETSDWKIQCIGLHQPGDTG